MVFVAVLLAFEKDPSENNPRKAANSMASGRISRLKKVGPSGSIFPFDPRR
jgi:hypothetical protein